MKLFALEAAGDQAKMMVFFAGTETPTPRELHTVVFAWHTPRPEYGSIFEVSCVKGGLSDSLDFMLKHKELFEEISATAVNRAPTLNEVSGILIKHGYEKLAGLETLLKTVSAKVKELPEEPKKEVVYPPLEVVRDLDIGDGTYTVKKPS